MREESGQSPVFHVPPGGTEAAARRPVSKEQVRLGWCLAMGRIDLGLLL